MVVVYKCLNIHLLSSNRGYGHPTALDLNPVDYDVWVATKSQILHQHVEAFCVNQ